MKDINLKRYNVIKYSLIIFCCLFYMAIATLLLTKSYLPKGSKISAVVAIQIAGVLVTILPLIFEKIFKLKYTIWAWIIYLSFCVLSMGIGSGLGMYNIISFYDFILHFCSGVVISFLTYAIFCKHINKNLSLKSQLFYTFLFALCFTVLIGVLWEVWEFSFDHFFNLNSQRHTDLNGNALLGHTALIDTMLDLIADTLGAFLTGGALSLFYLLKKQEPKNLFTFKPNNNLTEEKINEIKIEKEE